MTALPAEASMRIRAVGSPRRATHLAAPDNKASVLVDVSAPSPPPPHASDQPGGEANGHTTEFRQVSYE